MFFKDSDLASGGLYSSVLGTLFPCIKHDIKFSGLSILHISSISKMIHLGLIFKIIAFYTY